MSPSDRSAGPDRGVRAEARAARLSGQAESRFRPLERRRLRTSLPPRVLIRLRNPWTRARLWSLGWNVRFTMTLRPNV